MMGFDLAGCGDDDDEQTRQLIQLVVVAEGETLDRVNWLVTPIDRRDDAIPAPIPRRATDDGQLCCFTPNQVLIYVFPSLTTDDGPESPPPSRGDVSSCEMRTPH